MKILSIDNIRKGDQFTINAEPIASIDLMERASLNCYNWIIENIDKSASFTIIAGPGNNGGDGIAIARMLHNNGNKVNVIIIEYSENYSPDCQINIDRLKKLNIEINTVKSDNDNFDIGANDIIIDALFGSGLSREIEGFTANIVNYINELRNIVISIDIPSGLMGDELFDTKKPIIIKANHTLSIAFPKQVFFLMETAIYIGQWHHIDIGIHPTYAEMVPAEAYYITKSDIVTMLKKRDKFSHKGSFGHSMLIAGSYGKMGAAVMASRAAHRSGLGLLTTHIPKSAVDILQISSPETMLSIDENNEHFSKLKIVDNINSLGIGPGLGTDEESATAMKVLLQNYTLPMVIDADALNILSENKTWLAFLPSACILTPHPKEFERLAGKSSNSLERIKLQKEFSIRHKVFVILKGANTSISTPDGKLFINSTGNPGMATAGSGDVLTGIVLSLLAQDYHPQTAAILAVYLHGLAGDIAAFKSGFEALIASDIIDNIGETFITIS